MDIGKRYQEIDKLYWRNYKTKGRAFDALCEYFYYLNRVDDALWRPVCLAFEYDIDWQDAQWMIDRGKEMAKGYLKNETKSKTKKGKKALQKKKCGCEL